MPVKHYSVQSHIFLACLYINIAYLVILNPTLNRSTQILTRIMQCTSFKIDTAINIIRLFSSGHKNMKIPLWISFISPR